MSHSIFGWSYPPGCSGPPEPPEHMVLRCCECGSFLTSKSERTEPWESVQHCDGTVVELEYGIVSECGLDRPHDAHEAIMDAGITEFRTCHHCGAVNQTCG